MYTASWNSNPKWCLPQQLPVPARDARFTPAGDCQRRSPAEIGSQALCFCCHGNIFIAFRVVWGVQNSGKTTQRTTLWSSNDTSFEDVEWEYLIFLMECPSKIGWRVCKKIIKWNGPARSNERLTYHSLSNIFCLIWIASCTWDFWVVFWSLKSHK